ncbi:TRAP transporter small permease subunit [Chromatocurvus halotolerans]|uniref:TRAP transporter small permease protein n=1 Tax=Chromatocurvus halotolerans TaxID=1132028 RepID=A0A4R2KR59_9GAMM|nr:TRAP transporter small permease subunit [Chromatocurvus halotolerans]TCO72618.1 TRAP-type mannitol/chloroaromatic compound transport system permease small subunit [Chromatocurvus halotolerans]
MSASRRLVSAIDTFTEWTGKIIAWLAAAMAVLTTVVVVMRYGFSTGSIAGQEAVTYLHATLFMLGAAYALKTDAHVRVDIFYRRFSPTAQAWVNALGGIVFLLPLCLLIMMISSDYVRQAWRIREISMDSGGIPAVFLLKSLIPAMALTLLLQGIAEILRNLARLQQDAAR